MKKLITIVAVGLTVCGLDLGRAAAEHPCAGGLICTPCGPVGQYNAFSPVYKEACCPRCGQPCHDKHCHFTQCNAFSPLVQDCSKKSWWSWLHHESKAKPTCGDCPPNGCDWGYLGELPDAGTASVDSDMQVFPRGIIQGQPIGVDVQPLPSPSPTIKPVPANPESIKAPVQK